MPNSPESPTPSRDHGSRRSATELAFEQKLQANISVPLNEWYASQRETYRTWHTNVANRHRWRFLLERCSHCDQPAQMTVSDGQRHLCLSCLSSPVPWYPTGWVQPKVTALISHRTNCTSH